MGGDIDRWGVGDLVVWPPNQLDLSMLLLGQPGVGTSTAAEQITHLAAQENRQVVAIDGKGEEDFAAGGYDWRTETTPALRVTDRRLDAPAPTVTISDATNGFEPSMGAFMLLGLELPTGGCWELTGHYAGRSLRFVVLMS